MRNKHNLGPCRNQAQAGSEQAGPGDIQQKFGSHGCSTRPDFLRAHNFVKVIARSKAHRRSGFPLEPVLANGSGKPTRRPREGGDPYAAANIEKLRSMDPGPRLRSPGTTAHQHVVAVPACARTGSSGDPYAAAISRNCGVWIPGLARARPGRQHINTSSPSPPARGQAPAGTHRPQQYRETAEYGSRASLTLARDDRGTMAPGVCPRAGGEGNERGLVCAREITIGS